MDKYIKKIGEFSVRMIIIAIGIILIPLSFKIIPKTYDKFILTILVVVFMLLIILAMEIIDAQKKGPKGWIKKFLDWDKKMEKKWN